MVLGYWSGFRWLILWRVRWRARPSGELSLRCHRLSPVKEEKRRRKKAIKVAVEHLRRSTGKGGRGSRKCRTSFLNTINRSVRHVKEWRIWQERGKETKTKIGEQEERTSATAQGANKKARGKGSLCKAYPVFLCSSNYLAVIKSKGFKAGLHRSALLVSSSPSSLSHSSATGLVYLFPDLYIAFHLDFCHTKWGLTLGLIEIHRAIEMLIQGFVCKSVMWPGGRNMQHCHIMYS